MDNNTLNEDWLKTRTWDLYRVGTLVTTLPDFLWALGVTNKPEADQKEALSHAITLPSWIPAPKSLKDEVDAFLNPKTTMVTKKEADIIKSVMRSVLKKKVTDTFTPPQAVQSAGKRALGWLKEGKQGSGFTDTGRKRASDLANGHAVSYKTVKRMKAYFDRHQPDQNATGFNSGEEGFPSHGRVAWEAWGGDAGYSWAKGIVASVEGVSKSLEITKRKKSEMSGRKMSKKIVRHYSPLVATALVGSVKGLHQAVLTAVQHPNAYTDPQTHRAIAQQAVSQNVSTDNSDLTDNISNIYADAGVYGTDQAQGDLGSKAWIAGGLAALVAGLAIASWTVGDPQSAQDAIASDPNSGMGDLLAGAGDVASGISDTTVSGITDQIASGLDSGLSAQDIIDSINAGLFSNDRAEMIAGTEAQVAYNQSLLDQFRAAGITDLVWISYEGACPNCLAQEASFQMGDDLPPLHPNCVCEVALPPDFAG